MSAADPTLLPDGTRFIDAFVFDLNGIPRGKRLPAEDWPGVATRGVAFSASALVLDAIGVNRGPNGIGTADGDPDALGLPVPGSVVSVPWSEHFAAQALLAMRRDGAPIPFDPRAVLARVVAALRADGLHPVTACELEFYLVGRDAAGRPIPARGRGDAPGNAGHLCLQAVEDHGPFLHALHDALAVQGIAAGTIVSEYGAGQFEVNLRHGPDPVRAADEAALFRRAVHGVAGAQGLRASFMSKPFAQEPGSGLHVHVSLTDGEGRNLFAGEAGAATLRHAIGGLRAHHAETLGIMAPSHSAWRRLRGGGFVSAAPSWGENTRAASFRIPAGPEAARRVEHRVAAADASPHLVVAAVLAAMHAGVRGRLDPDAAVAAPPGDLLPALELLADSALLPDGYGAVFAAVKRGEAMALLAEPSEREWGFYL